MRIKVEMIEPGTMVGAFRVEELIGRGGMASVFRAVQVRLDRPVALKVLNPALAADEQFQQRFTLEGINSARLDHPNIVPVYEAGEDAGFAFLAMKLIDGETFASVISRNRLLQPAEALRILWDIAHALDYAHGMGFVHRDVKPGNVLLDSTGNVFLSDFGLSKDMGTRGITSTGQWMGTAEYMAPEQAAGLAIDFRADLYALACMAFECLTGDPPYLADNALAVMMAHASAEVPAATERNSDLLSAVDSVLRRGMSKQTHLRYPAAIAFAESLQAAAEGRPLTEQSEPAAGYLRYTGPSAQPPSTPTAIADAGRQWPMSAPPGTQSPVSNLFCPRCVGALEPEDLYCGDCGVQVLWCASCGGPRLPDDRFCQLCGATSEGGASP